MKVISKGMFSDKTERRRVSVKGPLLCMHLIHDSTLSLPREVYLISGMAIRMYDVWDYQFIVRGFKAKRSGTRYKVGDRTELTLVGFHEYPEQMYELLRRCREVGASLCDSCQDIISIVGTFRRDGASLSSPLSSRPVALRNALNELAKAEEGKPERGWVPLSKLITPEQIEHYQDDIAEEFSSVEFVDAYFAAATVCSNATQAKIDRLKSTDTDSSLEDMVHGDMSAKDIVSMKTMTTGMGEFGDLESELSTDASGDITSSQRRLRSTFDPSKPSINGRHCIIVLGPSAVGKTFSTKNALATVLEKNGWMSDMMFLSIDGGIMRDVSKTWNTMKALPSQVRGDFRYKGVSDLFSSYFKSYCSSTKKKLFRYCVKTGKNIIVPETAATPLPGMPSKVKDMLKLLKKYGYRVVMTAVSGYVSCKRLSLLSLSFPPPPHNHRRPPQNHPRRADLESDVASTERLVK